MTGEPTHTASKERMVPERMPQLSKTASKAQWTLRFAFSYVQPVTQRYRQKTVEEVPLQQSIHHENMTICTPPTIKYCLESAAAIMLHFQLCSARYTTLQMRTVLESSLQSVQSPQKIQTISCLQAYCRETMHHATANQHLGAVSKKKWDTKEDLPARLGTKRRQTVKKSSP